MPPENDDLYARYHTLAALVNVLLHDLRNPLHGATLIVEAMSSPTADTNALRERLRAQFGKFDGVLGEASHSIKQMALQPHIEAVSVDTLLQTIVAKYRDAGGSIPATFVLPAASSFTIMGDRRLLERAAIEIVTAIAEQESSPGEAKAATVTLGLDEPDPNTVRLRLGDFGPAFSTANAKTPFGIAGGGIRLAVARALTQNGGATLRWEPLEGGTARFALLMKKAV